MHVPCAHAPQATCHAPDRVGCYAEILRVTRPGGYFACYEWCTTDRWSENVFFASASFDSSLTRALAHFKRDATNEAHRTIKDNILVGNGLPALMSTREVLDSLVEAGWEIVEYR